MRESEQIELVLNVENSRVSIAELVPILQGFQGMTISMNDTLNKVYSCGFDNLLAELKKRLKISIFLWRKSCASRCFLVTL